MRQFLMIFPLVFGLVACSSSPYRSTPAPIEDSSGRPLEETPEAKTYGYEDATPGEFQEGRPQYQDALTDPAVGQVPAQRQEITEMAPAGKASSNTVLALLNTAKGQEQAGNLSGSAATIERALRVQPRNAVLWNKLAHLRFKQGQYSRAASLARKSNGLAGGNVAVKQSNLDLIARAQSHLQTAQSR
jgi:Tfp pilus assembly protein PilF